MRKKNYLAIALCFCVYISSAQTGNKEFKFTQNDRIVGLSKLWMEVKTNYVYYDQLTFDWDSLYEASIPRVMVMEDPFEYNRYLQKMCVMLEDGHTLVHYDIRRNPDDIVRPIPMQTKIFGEKIYVHSVFSNSLTDKGIVKGVELVKINGQNAYDYAVQNVMPYISYSTPQWQRYSTFCSFELTKGPSGPKMQFQVKDRKGKLFDVEVDKKSLDWNNQPDAFEYHTLPQNIGYLKITTFNDGESIRKFDAIYDQILTSDALVIDLRDNEGGNSNYADYILRHLTHEPIKTNQWASRMYIPTNASWGIENEWYMQGAVNMYPVNKEKYTKPIVVLTNEGTFSSAEDFCSVFRGMNRGKLVGTTTGGSTGNPIMIELVKDVATVIICTRKVLTPTGEVFVGIGIKPDIEIQETEADFLNNEDQVLEHAVTILKQM